MRRNSESLLLLAGREGARKWSEPVPLSDVARAAISEIEQYNRVTLNIQQGVSVAGVAVSDVVHLLAEVIENATTFSPKDTPVQMAAQEVSSGGVLIEVIDNGVGIPDDLLAAMNERLDNPPVVDVSVSRHMGLFAVGRLAERHGIRVRLRARTPQGIIAMVWLPDAIIQAGDSPYGRRHPALRQIGVQGRRITSGAPRSSLSVQADAPPPPPSPPHEPRRSVGVASSKWFSDPQAPGDGGEGNSGHSPRPAEQPGGGAFFRAAAQVVADPVRSDHTGSGLPLRVPQANLIPGSMDGARQGDTVVPGYQADRREAQAPAPSWPPQRSPDIARSRLSGFQSGVRRGKSQTPRAGEGSDR
jgi:anti-sigma regulatory factor (Ser/Thr protein kinase)